MTVLSFQAPSDLAAELDALVASRPDRATRSVVLRELLVEALLARRLARDALADSIFSASILDSVNANQ